MSSASGKLNRQSVVKVAVTLEWCAALTALSILPAHAEDHVVRTRASQWVPIVLFIQPGDTVIWQGMEGHETELIAGMGPEGASIWRSELDAEGFGVTLEQAGAYIYKCAIHMNVGMVGAIVVGDDEPRNIGAIDAALEKIEQGRAFVERVIGRMKRELNRR